MILPCVNMGSQNIGQINKKFCIHYNTVTQFNILVDTVECLREQGVKVLVIINGHNGNAFKAIVRDVENMYSDFKIFVCNYLDIIEENKQHFKSAIDFPEVDDHAGFTETSMMMAYYPQFVRFEYLDKQKEDQIGGVLYKGINWKQGSNLLTYNGLPKDTTIWGAWECKYPDSISAEGWTPLRKLIEFCRYRSDADFEMQYRDYFYRDNLIAYSVLVYALCIRDTGWKNCYLSQRRRGEGPFLLTVWDMDYSFGEMFNGDYDTTCVTYDKMSKTAPFNRLYVTDMDGFRSSVISLWQTCRTTMLHPDSINALMETYAESFVASGAWERERQRWDNKPVPLQPDIHDELAYVDSWYRKNYDTLSTLWAGKDVFTAVQRKTQDSPSSHSKTAYSLFGLPVRVDDLPAGTLYIEDSRLHFAR